MPLGKTSTVIGLSPNASRDHLQFTTDMKKALSDADFVQENGPERKDFKIKLFADMDAATPPDSIIASSSSGLTMSIMQSACKHPERCVIGHPFNPPHVIPSGRGRCRRRKHRQKLSNKRSPSMHRSARNRSKFAKRLSATSLTACKPRFIAKSCISSSRACSMLLTRMRRCAGGRDCGGE